MATFNERIQVVIDVVTDKATKGFKDFKTAVGEANGFTGKLKAGVSSLGSMFTGAVAGPAALGTAVATAGKIAWDAVTDFANLGVQVANFSAATGLAAEDASRWIEVAGDLGIDAGTLETTIGKLNRTIDPALFDRLGVSIARTANGAVDINGTFLNVIDRLRDIKDPAERARVAAQLLGRGWQTVAPLIARSAKDIKDQLADVADVKVLSNEDTKRAQDFDKALQDVKDAAETLATKLGEGLLPVVANTLGPLADLADMLVKVSEYGNPGGQTPLGFLTEQIKDLSEWIGNLFEDDVIEYTGRSITKLGDSAGYAARYVGLANQKQDAAQQTAAKLATNVREATTAYKNLKSELTGQKTLVDLKLQLEGNAQKLKDLKKDFDEGKISGRDYMLEVASATLDSKLAIESYAEALGNVPPDVMTDVVVNFDPYAPGNIDAELNRWAKNKTVFVSVALGGVTVDPTRKPDNPVNNPPKDSDRPTTGNRSGTTNVNIKVDVAPGGNPVATGRAVHDALQAYYRAGGERP